ncbi:MAG: hypothetical protein PUF12_00470 [Thermoflexaceae bacterium]|nr:hypothetical protein [Thermoflexaceae bacterium]
MDQEKAILQIISEVTKIKEAPCKKKIQKLVISWHSDYSHYHKPLQGLW